jgi:hypothetical protein
LIQVSSQVFCSIGLEANFIPPAEEQEVHDGYMTSLLFVTAQPSARMLNVKCVASNYVGYVEDLSEDYLTCKL